ncbi:hypothetical protein, partial [Klebsiella pneumoniae]|uniref:hypothetical protein n=1 Tax=Klebsiella pneumoniae TaxID=573 RepID=UPI00298D1228
CLSVVSDNTRCCRDLQGGAKYLSYFKFQVRWLRSLTPVTYWSKLLGIPSLAAFLQLELFKV